MFEAINMYMLKVEESCGTSLWPPKRRTPKKSRANKVFHVQAKKVEKVIESKRGMVHYPPARIRMEPKNGLAHLHKPWSAWGTMLLCWEVDS